jgi:hypothetical protein
VKCGRHITDYLIYHDIIAINEVMVDYRTLRLVYYDYELSTVALVLVLFVNDDGLLHSYPIKLCACLLFIRQDTMD